MKKEELEELKKRTAEMDNALLKLSDEEFDYVSGYTEIEKADERLRNLREKNEELTRRLEELSKEELAYVTGG